jgi:hypothetical protein
MSEPPSVRLSHVRSRKAVGRRRPGIVSMPGRSAPTGRERVRAPLVSLTQAPGSTSGRMPGQPGGKLLVTTANTPAARACALCRREHAAWESRPGYRPACGHRGGAIVLSRRCPTATPAKVTAPPTSASNGSLSWISTRPSAADTRGAANRYWAICEAGRRANA